MANVTASVSGGVPPYSYQWSGAGGYGAAASLTPASVGDRSVSVKVSDGDGYTVEETFIVRVGPGKVKMEGLKGDVFYGETTSLNAWGMGLKESEPPPDAKPAKSAVDCAKNPNSPFCVETTHGGLIDNTKTGDSKTDKSSDWTIREVTSENAEKVYIPDPGSEDDYDMPPEEEKKESEYEVVWQSEPAVTFDPPTSTDGWTKITYDRADEIKVWCEMHKMIDGTFQTVGECEQQTVMVKPPAFSISFSPENGEAHVGQKVIATIHASPGVNADLIDYRWLDPPTSNRLELDKNSSRIELTVKDINPIKLNVIARVPVHGDELGEIKSSYTGVSYSVNAWMVQPPNQPQVWDS